MTSHGDGVNVCAVQLPLRPPNESPMEAVARVRQQLESATTNNPVDLFVLPELAPLGYSEDTFANFLPTTLERQQIVKNVEEEMKNIAIELQTCICFGTIGIMIVEDDRPTTGDTTTPYFTIRQLVVDTTGDIIACYDKMHLCDYGNCAETRFFRPGKTPCAFTLQLPPKRHPCMLVKGSMTFGIVICADMRYPMLARRLTKDFNVDVILQPAAFQRDISFRTWDSFRETRAVENSVYWVAVNYAGADYGESAIVPPWVDEDNEPIKLGTESALLTEILSLDKIQWARSSMPFYRALMMK